MAASLTRSKIRVIFRRYACLKNCRSFSKYTALRHEANSSQKTTHFGFQTVSEEEKEGKGIVVAIRIHFFGHVMQSLVSY